MHGAKVAVVVVSVFNTLNTIDCRLGGGQIVEGCWSYTGQIFEVSPGEEVDLNAGLEEVWIQAARFVVYIFAINVKQIYRKTESKGAGLAVLKAQIGAFERQGNDFARSRCVSTGPIMLLIKYPTSQ